jgi:RNA polymerase sigma factor (sigma-70 family)
MPPEPSTPSLTCLTTLWGVVLQARDDIPGQRIEARRRLLERYEPAVLRFLRKAVRDEDAARDLLQEFAVRFMSGGLDGADPKRGRFRDFVKGVLRHLIVDAYRKGNRLRQHESDAPEVGTAAMTSRLDRQYRELA